MKDVRYALRMLAASPGFAAAAILTLALGIGANTAIFQLLDALRLRSLPVPRPHELVEVVVDGGNRGYGVSQGILRQPDQSALGGAARGIRRRSPACSRGVSPIICRSVVAKTLGWREACG